MTPKTLKTLKPLAFLGAFVLAVFVFSCAPGPQYRVEPQITREGGACVYVLKLQKNVLERLLPFIEECSKVCKIEFYAEAERVILVPRDHFYARQRACRECWERLKVLVEGASELTVKAYEGESEAKAKSLEGAKK